jgi:hypothetical protein
MLNDDPHAAGRARLLDLERIAARCLNDIQGDDSMANDLRNSKDGVLLDKSLRHLEGPGGSTAGRNFGHSPCSPPIPGAEISPASPGMNAASSGKQVRR